MIKKISRDEAVVRAASAKSILNYVTKDLSTVTSLSVVEAKDCKESEVCAYDRMYFVLEGTLHIEAGNHTSEIGSEEACFIDKGTEYTMSGSFKAIVVNVPAYGALESQVATTFIVAGAVIEKDGKYLLVQERQPRAYGLWNLPAGRVDVGESLEDTAVREAKEETGLDVELIHKLGIFQDKSSEPPKHAYLARITGGELITPNDEVMDLRFFTYNEIEQLGEKLRNSWILEAIKLTVRK